MNWNQSACGNDSFILKTARFGLSFYLQLDYFVKYDKIIEQTFEILTGGAIRMRVGDTAYIVESNRIIREVKIIRCSGGIFLVKFPDTGGGIQVKRHRLFATREEAENSIAKPIEKKKTNPYKYWH